MKMLLMLLVVMNFYSCKRAAPLSSKLSVKNEYLYNGDQTFHKDGKGGLFNNIKWYFYHFNEHKILPLFDVYAIKWEGGVSLIQIQNYYLSDKPGFYTLKIRKASGAISYVEIDASACGNTNTNPDYANCVKNPAENTYTYFNLDTLDTFKVSREESLVSEQWHIAFKNTDIKLNSGMQGPLNVVGALAYRNEYLFEGAIAQVDRLLEVLLDNQGDFYMDNLDVNGYNYFPEDGIDRVIYEDYWWENEGNELNGRYKKAVNENWWVLRSSTNDSFFKFHISKIEHIDEESFLEIEYYPQLKGEKLFSQDATHMRVGPIQYIDPFINICIDFDLNSSGKCESNSHDLKLTTTILNNKYKWIFSVSSGAYGPLKEYEIMSIDNH